MSVVSSSPGRGEERESSLVIHSEEEEHKEGNNSGLKCVGCMFFIWIACLVHTFVAVTYPEACSYPRNTAQFASSCFEPLLEPSQRIDVLLYTGSSKDYLHESSVLVWAARNQSVDEQVEAVVRVPVPSEVRTQGNFLNCWIVIAPTLVTLPTRSNGEVQGGGADEEQIRQDVLANERHQNYVNTRRIVLDHRLTALRPASDGGKQKRNLLQSQDDDASSPKQQHEEEEKMPLVQHWLYSYHALIIRYTHFGQTTLAHPFLPAVNQQLSTRYVRDVGGARNQAKYEPIVFVDDISLLKGHHVELSRNTSMPSPLIKIRFSPTSSVHFAFKKTMSVIISILAEILAESELEEIKYWLSEERLLRYFLTQAITWIHILLEYLAFRDDWKFFVGRKTFRGVSSTSMFFSVFRSLVIFLYLFESDTSTLILLSVGKDIVWSAWKLCRVVKPRFYFRPGTFTPCFSYLESGSLTPEERQSAEYDHIATMHMGLCIYPLVVGLAIYSLLNYTYKSWWSWFISSLADAVYFFGFISMTPQLYINYRLKSVAHLPVRAFGYKIFNTFIDDVFAFMGTYRFLLVV